MILTGARLEEAGVELDEGIEDVGSCWVNESRSMTRVFYVAYLQTRVHPPPGAHPPSARMWEGKGSLPPGYERTGGHRLEPPVPSRRFGEGL